MRVHLFLLCIFSLLLLHSFEAFPQNKTIPLSGFKKGFIIKYNGDTIKGKLLYPAKDSIPGIIYFRPVGGKKGLRNTFDIAGFGNYITRKVYRTIEVPKITGPELSFVRVIMDGDYDLFYFSFRWEDHFLIRDTNGKLTDLNNITNADDPMSSYRENLKLAFADSPEIPKEYYRTEPKEEPLKRMLQNYYDKKGLNYINYSGFSKNYSWGIIAGNSFDTFIPGLSGKKLSSSSKPYPYAGLTLSSTNPNTGRGVFLQSTVGFESYHYSFSDLLPTGTGFNESFIKTFISTTRTGFTIEEASQNALRPFFEGGAVVSLLFLPVYENYYDFLSTDNLHAFSFHDHNRLHPAFYYGLFIRTGMSYKIQKMNSLRLSIGYDILKSKGGAGINSLDLALTYKIKFR